MQARAPVPNGLKVCAGRAHTAWASKRSGANPSASAPHTAGSRCSIAVRTSAHAPRSIGWTVEERPELGLAVRGWLAFTRAVCLEWVSGAGLSREQVRDLCARALLGAIGH